MRAFQGGNFGNERDAREAAERLLNAMAEGNRDPLNRMGKLIAQGFEEKAGPVISAAQTVAGALPGVSGVGSVVQAGLAGGAPAAALAGAASGAAGVGNLFMGAQQSGNQGFLGAPTFAGDARANFEGRFAQEDFWRNRALELGPLNFSNVDKESERFLRKEATKRRSLEDEPTARVLSRLEPLARMGIDVDDDALDRAFNFEQAKTVRQVDLRERLGNIASTRTRQFLHDQWKRDRGFSSDQNSYDGKR